MNFAKNIRLFRKRLGISQGELAEKINVSQRTVSHYERGDSEPTLLIVCRIARYFNVSLDTLIGYDEDIRPINN